MEEIDGWQLGNFTKRSLIGSRECDGVIVNKVRQTNVILPGGETLTVFRSIKPNRPSLNVTETRIKELRMPNYMKPLMPDRIPLGLELRPQKIVFASKSKHKK